MESLLDEVFTAQIAAQVDHADIEKVVPIAEISKIDKVALTASEYSVAVLEIPMDGGILIWSVRDEFPDLVFLG